MLAKIYFDFVANLGSALILLQVIKHYEISIRDKAKPRESNIVQEIERLTLLLAITIQIAPLAVFAVSLLHSSASWP
jgi:hypothetical protein